MSTNYWILKNISLNKDTTSTYTLDELFNQLLKLGKLQKPAILDLISDKYWFGDNVIHMVEKGWIEIVPRTNRIKLTQRGIDILNILETLERIKVE